MRRFGGRRGPGRLCLVNASSTVLLIHLLIVEIEVGLCGFTNVIKRDMFLFLIECVADMSARGVTGHSLLFAVKLFM